MKHVNTFKTHISTNMTFQYYTIQGSSGGGKPTTPQKLSAKRNLNILKLLRFAKSLFLPYCTDILQVSLCEKDKNHTCNKELRRRF